MESGVMQSLLCAIAGREGRRQSRMIRMSVLFFVPRFVRNGPPEFNTISYRIFS